MMKNDEPVRRARIGSTGADGPIGGPPWVRLPWSGALRGILAPWWRSDAILQPGGPWWPPPAWRPVPSSPMMGRTAPRRTCATSRMVAPRRFASSATGSPYSGQGCARTAPPRCSAASTGQSIARRLTAAASAAGIEGRITGHSGRVGLAVELTRRGAPEQATAKAGGWKSSRMVAHYAAAVAAEQGAVATCL